MKALKYIAWLAGFPLLAILFLLYLGPNIRNAFSRAISEISEDAKSHYRTKNYIK